MQTLTDEQQQFIERVGLYFEQYHLSRIGGRLLGLLLLSEHPLGLNEMAELLQVSLASVSTNIRLTTDFGMTERVSFPGDRRSYYQARPQLGMHNIQMKELGTRQLRQVVQSGLMAITAEMAAAREHLTELVHFCDFLIADSQGMDDRWHAYRQARQHSHSPPTGDNSSGEDTVPDGVRPPLAAT